LVGGLGPGPLPSPTLNPALNSTEMLYMIVVNIETILSEKCSHFLFLCFLFVDEYLQAIKVYF